jgi:hypothetical protein
MRRADRGYFFVVGLACAVGYSYRVWLLPPVALAALEGVSALGVRFRATATQPRRLPLRRPDRASVTQSADRAA